MTWTDNRSAGFDLETTGVNVETARIVTGALVFRGGGNNPGYHDARTWLSDVSGEEIPEAATAVHGITTAHAHVDGDPAMEVVKEITAALYEVMAEGLPVVAFNGRYDFTVLDRECRRYGVATLEDRLGRQVGPVIDPFVIDKQADKYRKGSRKLEALAAHYGVTLTDAHSADADALAALEVAVALAEKYDQLRVDADTLHGWQVKWAAEQAVSFRSYRGRQGLSTGDIVEAWPVVPYLAPEPDMAVVIASLTDLVGRWEQIAKTAPDLGDELLIDEPSPVESLQIERAHAYRQAAADVRDVLATGRIPHGLMTSAELGDEQPVGGAL